MDSDKIKLTGLWRSESKAGGTYLSGRISPTSKLLILPNSFKKTEKDPDYIAYITPQEERQEQAAEKPARSMDL